MDLKLRTRSVCFIVVNLMLLIILYNIPIDSEWLTTICIIKKITGKNCWNCGMTRAFLSVLHLNFEKAYQYNQKVIIVFPLTVGTYVYSWYKYILRKENKENE